MNKMRLKSMTTGMQLAGFAIFGLIVSGLAYGQWANTGTQAPQSPSTAQVVVTQVDWVKTVVGMQAAQTPALKESGTMYFAADGRVRDERYSYNRSGETTFSVRLLDHVNNTKLVLDFDQQVAVSSPLRRTTTTGRGPGSTYTVGSTLVTDNVKASLGEKIVGGLRLEGSRQTMNLNIPNRTILAAHETWIYRMDAHPGAVIVMEHRYEDGDSITDQRITQVNTVTISGDMLELPTDFVVNIGQ